MPALATVVLKDNSGTDRSFTPRGVASGVASIALGNGVPASDQTITFTRTKTASGRIKATAKLALPVVQNVEQNGITNPIPVRATYVTLTVDAASTSSADERADAIAFTKNLLGNAFGISVFKDLENVWG